MISCFSISSEQPDPTTASVKQAESPVTTTTAEASSTAKPLSPTELAAQTRERIESDLRIWQQKFAAAADKGVEDLEDRIKAIVDSYIETGAKTHGETLFTALEEVVQHELAGIKQRITLLTESLPVEEAPEEEELAQAQLSADIKEAAITIRDHAHALRQWHKTFDEELDRRVSDAVNTTLNVLDSVRDLGLQEIGMRWAWMDGVTYKDWEKYHALKAQFDDWRGQFRAVGLQHAKVEEARVLADDVLGRGMDAAESAAKELARLKDVGKWKVAAREVSEDFETRTGPPPALPRRNTTSEQNSVEESPELNEQAPLDYQDAADRDAQATSSHNDPEEQGMGLDDAPLFEESSEQSSQPADDKEGFVAANEQNRGPGHIERPSWGVSAADVETSHDAPTVDEPIEMLHSILNAADDKVPIKQADAQDSNSPETAAQSGPDYAAVEDLVSQLLDGKDPSFAQDMMKKLHAIYGKSSQADADESEENAPTESSTPATETSTAADDEPILPDFEEPIKESEHAEVFEDLSSTEQTEDASNDVNQTGKEDL